MLSDTLCWVQQYSHGGLVGGAKLSFIIFSVLSDLFLFKMKICWTLSYRSDYQTRVKAIEVLLILMRNCKNIQCCSYN